MLRITFGQRHLQLLAARHRDGPGETAVTHVLNFVERCGQLALKF